MRNANQKTQASQDDEKAQQEAYQRGKTYVGVLPEDLSKRKLRSELDDAASGHDLAADGRKLAHSTRDHADNSLLNSYKQEFFRRHYGGMYYYQE